MSRESVCASALNKNLAAGTGGRAPEWGDLRHLVELSPPGVCKAKHVKRRGPARGRGVGSGGRSDRLVSGRRPRGNLIQMWRPWCRKTLDQPPSWRIRRTRQTQALKNPVGSLVLFSSGTSRVKMTELAPAIHWTPPRTTRRGSLQIAATAPCTPVRRQIGTTIPRSVDCKYWGH